MDPNDTPDLTPLVRQRHLDSIVLTLLAGSEWDDTIDGVDYELIADDTSGDYVSATLWQYNRATHDYSTEVAQVRLDITVTPATPGGAA